MKRFVTIAAILLVTIFVNTTAGTYTPETLPKVHLYDSTRYVVNPDGILSQSAAVRIDTMLRELENKTGTETVVAVVESIGEQDCFNFCHTLLNSWGVGKKGKDNGLVILLVTDQRCIQFNTGYGLEGILPDAICKRIQMQQMVPYLKQGDWDTAMINGVEAVCRRLYSEPDDTQTAPENNTSPLLLLALLVIIIAIVTIKTRQISNASRKCPKCGKPDLKPTDSCILVEKDGKQVNRRIYKCSSCGYTVARDEDENNGDDGTPPGGPRRRTGSLLDAILLGTLLGGMGRGRGGGFGGGFGGGSFGGGAGGGGGAGSRF